MAYHNRMKSNQEKQMLIYGHRGHSYQYPENTVASVRSALEHSHGAEIDVQWTKDGYVIVLHDHTLRRTALAQAGVSERLLDRAVQELNWADINDIEVGKPGALSKSNGQSIPLLEDILDLYLDPQFSAKRLLIEVKSISSLKKLGSAEKIVGALNKIFQKDVYQSLLANIAFISFDEDLLVDLAKSDHLQHAQFYLVVEAADIQNPANWPKLIDKIHAFDGIDLESDLNLLQRNGEGRRFTDLVHEKNKTLLTWVNRGNRTDGWLFYQLCSHLGIHAFTSDLDVSLLDLALTKARQKQITDFLERNLALQNHATRILESQLYVYAPFSGMVDPRQGAYLSFKRDLAHLQKLAKEGRVVFYLGDLTESELSDFASAFRHYKQKFTDEVFITASSLPVVPVDSLATYQSLWAEVRSLESQCFK